MIKYQIDKIISHHPITKNIFIKTVPCDTHVQSDKFPYALVMNTDDSKKPGVHWTAIYVTSSTKAEYFDSYGELPNPCISKYLEKFPTVKLIKHSIQSPFSTACGQFCCIFIIKRASGIPFEDIIKYFHDLGDERDKYVEYIVRKIAKKL